VPPEVAEEVLDRLVEVGLVDDASFAQAWFERQGRRLRSTTALRRELRTKGVDAEVIATAAETVDPEADLEAARELVRKRAPQMAGVPAQARYRRLAGQLARRGFGPSVIAAALHDIEDAEESAAAESGER
jgi:regulatory protein